MPLRTHPAAGLVSEGTIKPEVVVCQDINFTFLLGWDRYHLIFGKFLPSPLLGWPMKPVNSNKTFDLEFSMQLKARQAGDKTPASIMRWSCG
jgi:hypothetical protein